MLEEHGNLDNLRMATGKLEGEYHGPLFMDSDVYKLLEAIGWERQHGAAADQERFLEEAGTLLGAVLNFPMVTLTLTTRSWNRPSALPTRPWGTNCTAPVISSKPR